MIRWTWVLLSLVFFCRSASTCHCPSLSNSRIFVIFVAVHPPPGVVSCLSVSALRLSDVMFQKFSLEQSFCSGCRHLPDSEE